MNAIDAITFCNLHAAKVSLIVAFLANAKPLCPKYNKACTAIRLGLRFGKKIVTFQSDIEVLMSDNPDIKLMDRLFHRFGLGSQWHIQKQQIPRYATLCDMKKELKKRGGSAGFDLLENMCYDLKKSGVPQKKRTAVILRNELARAQSAVRKARKSGATVRQLNKLVRTVMGEEAVAEVQGS